MYAKHVYMARREWISDEIGMDDGLASYLGMWIEQQAGRVWKEPIWRLLGWKDRLLLGSAGDAAWPTTRICLVNMNVIYNGDRFAYQISWCEANE